MCLVDHFIVPGGEGRFSIDCFPTHEALMERHEQDMQSYPLVVKDGRVVSGYLLWYRSLRRAVTGLLSVSLLLNSFAFVSATVYGCHRQNIFGQSTGGWGHRYIPCLVLVVPGYSPDWRYLRDRCPNRRLHTSEHSACHCPWRVASLVSNSRFPVFPP